MLRTTLEKWISDAETVRLLDHFRVRQVSIDVGHVTVRADDYYFALIGELFDRLRGGVTAPDEWARLGNALTQFAGEDWAELSAAVGVSVDEARLFAATAFYCGGFSASAYLAIGRRAPGAEATEARRACFDLLARPKDITSLTVEELVGCVRKGDTHGVAMIAARVRQDADDLLPLGAARWIPAKLLSELVARFAVTNIRAVLPSGDTDAWTPLVRSLLGRRPPTWEYFPSQIQAIGGGLLDRAESFALQMPTGAGKTTVCETLLFWHTSQNPDDVAIMLVPSRSLASELRRSLVRRLNGMGISSRCAYGGTVPTGDEVRGLEATRVLVATPEALSGLLSANEDFSRRISLVICDEGHLLDAGGRGIGLELLLARLKARETPSPRFVFVSAIVPNIEEINLWLGGTDETVVRSDYRPALAEFGMLRPVGAGAKTSIDLVVHPHEDEPVRFTVEKFLSASDFTWLNPATNHYNSYPHSSVKAQAVAAARKALPMGSAVIFAANKRGDRGALGIAHEVLHQLDRDLALPKPSEFMDPLAVGPALEYMATEYGSDWVGTKCLASGLVLHHGDVPQETREVLEQLLSRRQVRLAVCTSTLAEGVNFPIRTIVLYSVRRVQSDGRPEDLLTRDIKNLVGRAGRAGATTKGLVICANPEQWPLVARVANQSPGESVTGALRGLLTRLRSALAVAHVELDNDLLENEMLLHPLVDGVDATLIDLAAEELGDEELELMATRLAEGTFASQQANEEDQHLLQSVFSLRAHKVESVRGAGRLGWIRETGARLRVIGAVESGLLPSTIDWETVTNPISHELVEVVLGWALKQPEMDIALREQYRLHEGTSTDSVHASFAKVVRHWLAGDSFASISRESEMPIDDILGVYTGAISFKLQTQVEQGLALLEKLMESDDRILAPEVRQLSEHLRFGVPSKSGLALASGGLRHRAAVVALGRALASAGLDIDDYDVVRPAALDLLNADPNGWQESLGALLYERTLRDLAASR